MKNVMKTKSMVLLGSLAGTCLMGTVAFANPSMVPDHPGYPMKGSKSPVTGVPTANDPGRENFYGQEALSAATTEGNQDQKLRSRSSLNKESMEEFHDEMSGQNQKSGQSQIKSQSQMNAGEQGMNIGEQMNRQNEKLQ